jgi:hypothetical protein
MPVYSFGAQMAVLLLCFWTERRVSPPRCVSAEVVTP